MKLGEPLLTKRRAAATSLAPMRARGFTLLEILVAIAIFAIVGMLAMLGYNELVAQSERIETSAQRTRAIQAAMMRLDRDFATLEPRPVREPMGGELEPALSASPRRTEVLVEFTHSGWSNPAGMPRPTLQRVAYRLLDKKLYRAYWPALDRTTNTEPLSVMLLDRVKGVSLRYLANDRDWKQQWPPLGYSGADASFLRPIAVEITLELEDWGKIIRLIEVPG